MRARAVLASLASLALFAAATGARDGVVATLAAKESFLQVGKPLKLELALENRGAAPATASNAFLFGGGLVVERDGEAPFFVGVPNLPAGAKQELVLPPGASARAVVDLAALAPAPLSKPGKIRVRVQLASVANEPLELELAPDWTGWHAVIATNLGEMELEFFPDRAPRTVANFLGLAQKGFYDGLTFHRVVKGFMIQGGDPKGDGTGNSGTTIPFERTGVVHERGVISMARGASLDSASCQFFVCHQKVPFLDGNYAAFGRVVRGLETLDRIAEVECVMAPGGADRVPSRPKELVTIKKVTLVAPGAQSR